MQEDWRLFKQQEKYMYGILLIKQPYKPQNKNNDHDHCEFCMNKFGFGIDDLHYGYSSEDRSIWVCEQCYEDFKNKFKWKVKLE